MHKRNSPPNNTLATNPQIQAPIKAESMAAMSDMGDIETVQD